MEIKYYHLKDQECLLPWEKEKREILVKKEAETDWKYGEDPWKRPIEKLLKYAVINLDKPKGPTSHQVVSWVRDIVSVKAGHGGTLDPKVTGVLPVAIGQATKVLRYLLTAGKEYVTLMVLHKPVSEEKIFEAIKKFTGEIIQLPPLKSAVKRRPRKKKVYDVKIIEIIDNRYVLLRIATEAGVYIRKWVHDIGQYLGVGAHMQELRRTKAGPFNEKDPNKPLVTLQDIVDSLAFWKEEGNEKYLRKVFLPPEVAIEHLPKIWILDTAVSAVAHGANLAVPGIAKLHSGIKPGDWVAIMTLKNELVAIGKALMTSEEMLEKNRGIAVDVERVFIDRNLYPKVWKKKQGQ